jgi:hypothetical protein
VVGYAGWIYQGNASVLTLGSATYPVISALNTILMDTLATLLPSHTSVLYILFVQCHIDAGSIQSLSAVYWRKFASLASLFCGFRSEEPQAIRRASEHKSTRITWLEVLY